MIDADALMARATKIGFAREIEEMLRGPRTAEGRARMLELAQERVELLEERVELWRDRLEHCATKDEALAFLQMLRDEKPGSFEEEYWESAIERHFGGTLH